MYKLLQISDFQMFSEEQTENFEIFLDDEQKCDYYPIKLDINPLLKKNSQSIERSKLVDNQLKSGENLHLKADFRNKMLLSNSQTDKCLENPMLKMRSDIHLQNSRLFADFHKFFTGLPKINFVKPP